ncbi:MULTISPECIES: M42 family metallopeptidase [Thermoactinomyces]|jgi:putative aminopeptidase FrvX|uniref:M42 family metallopeptidase n=1 Tax=Thermoactinomyces daqus TaxID=1329516 RepID=A0A7W1XBN5_9BACL|nr:MULTISPECIES: M42 family metallopeptidase [Thermoactinomyces]MBA4543692.1 M42 family metallopeptidase [Thermoactinomyces daqus]MBH8597143.1 M42 family metallopeptidase [Thermoactinomyces sp. CICC 10523]MBH8602703.1 M42 family metallopeptidase [Thermoactinomyces sp. CICC 10522]MBH8606186.1 M42 family metallopeptidase [Thermoactinomyces sp. CICC 10521]
MISFPEETVLQTLIQLLEIHSPTGRAEKAVDYIHSRLKQSGLNAMLTAKGGLIVTVPGENDQVHRLVTVHVDTLGAMVKEIKENGRLRLSKIGGFGWFSVDGAYCRVETRKGRMFSGTILASHTSVHVYADAEEQKRSDEHMEVRLDERVKSAQDVKALGIRVGDFVSFDPQVVTTEAGFIKARHLDDKASAAILLELLLYLHESSVRLPHTTHFFFSNFEEVGFGANSSIPPQVREYLAVDMGAIGEGQTTDEYCVSICAKDGSGPYHYGLTTKLIEIAEREGIYHQVDLYPFYASDASAAVRAGYDMMHALIGPGVDGSHAYERTHLEALKNTYLLLYHYLLSPSL